MTAMATGSPTFLLPTEAYRQHEWYDREQRLLFARSWALVGATDDLRAPGDWLTAFVGGVPLVVVVDGEGSLRAFHNMCRHRGMVLLEGTGTGCQVIRCGYHDWRFGLDGSLLVVPQRPDQFPGLDADALGLVPAAVGVWEGMVFACPDAEAQPLGELVAEFRQAIGSFRPSLLPVIAAADMPARCNWKLLVENHIDVYHLWYLHRETLAEFDHRRFEHHAVGPNWVSYEPLRDPDGPGRPGAGTTPIAHIDERDRAGIGAHLLFPNVLFASTAEFFMSYAVVPEAPDRSRIEVRLRAEPSADGARLLAAAQSFIAEDIAACERIQHAVGSPWFSVGPLARTHEAPIQSFQQHVLDRLA